MGEKCQKPFSAELTEEDKVLIMELMANEISSWAKNNLDCQISRGKSEIFVRVGNQDKISSDTDNYCGNENTCKLESDCLELSKETREVLIKHLIKDFFLSKKNIDPCMENSQIKESEITLNANEEEKLLSIVNSKQKENEAKCNPKIPVNTNSNHYISENKFGELENNANILTNKKATSVDNTKSKQLEETDKIGLKTGKSSASCILELSSFGVDDNQIGLSSQEEAEIKKLIESIEKEYMKDETSTEGTQIRKKSCKCCSDIKDSIKEHNFSTKHQEKLSHKTTNLEKHSKLEINNSNEINYNNDLVINYDEVTDCLQMEWKMNADETCNNIDVMSESLDNLIALKGERTSYRKKNKNKRKKSRYLMPMNDEESPFYIDRKLFPVFMYQQGLMFSKWNPTQALYEVCSKCYWPSPDFVQVDYQLVKGFLFGVKVNDIDFLPEKWGKTKKLAIHQASTHFLNFIGFKFTYEPTQEFNFSSQYTEDCDNKAHIKLEIEEQKLLNSPVLSHSDNDDCALDSNNHSAYSKQVRSDTYHASRRQKIRKRDSSSPHSLNMTKRSCCGCLSLISTVKIANKSTNDDINPENISSRKCYESLKSTKTGSIKYEPCDCTSPARNVNSFDHTHHDNFKYYKGHKTCSHRELTPERNCNSQLGRNVLSYTSPPTSTWCNKPYDTDHKKVSSNIDQCRFKKTVLNTKYKAYTNNQNLSSLSSDSSSTSSPMKSHEPTHISKCNRIVWIREQLNQLQ